MNRWALWLVLLVPVAGVQAAPTKASELRSLRSQAVQALILRADVDSLATAALLSYKRPATPSALELAGNAAEMAPQSAPLGWLHLQLCVQSPGCGVKGVATTLRWVDPDNGAAWLPILAPAYKERDWHEVDRVIVEMAAAPRFDLYWNRLVVLMAEALRKARATLPPQYATSDAERYELVSSLLGELIPGFSPLLDACRLAPAASERHEECVKLSRSMQRGDTFGAQIAGFGLARRLLPADSRESKQLAEQRKLLETRIAKLERLDARALQSGDNAWVRRRLAKMRALPREEDVSMAILRETHR